VSEVPFLARLVTKDLTARFLVVREVAGSNIGGSYDRSNRCGTETVVERCRAQRRNTLNRRCNSDIIELLHEYTELWH